MNISDRIRELIADSHEHGYGSELPESVTRLVHELAAVVEGGAAPAVPVIVVDHSTDIAVLQAQMRSCQIAIDGIGATVERISVQLSQAQNAPVAQAPAPVPAADPGANPQPAAATPAAEPAPAPVAAVAGIPPGA